MIKDFKNYKIFQLYLYKSGSEGFFKDKNLFKMC
jgi:hypothetical protein